MKKLTNTKLLWILLIALVVVVLGWKACHAAPISLAQQIKNNFYFTTGFRWDQDCPATVCQQNPRPTDGGHHDPAFVGAMLRLPVSAHVVVGGNFDRDFTDAPNWNARAYIAVRPW